MKSEWHKANNRLQTLYLTILNQLLLDMLQLYHTELRPNFPSSSVAVFLKVGNFNKTCRLQLLN